MKNEVLLSEEETIRAIIERTAKVLCSIHHINFINEDH